MLTWHVAITLVGYEGELHTKKLDSLYSPLSGGLSVAQGRCGASTMGVRYRGTVELRVSVGAYGAGKWPKYNEIARSVKF